MGLLYAQLRVGNMVCESYKTQPNFTRFHVHAVSEGVVALAAGFAVAEKLLSLEDTVCDVLSQYRDMQGGEALRRVRFRHLLTMTAGVGDVLAGAGAEALRAEKDWLGYFFKTARLITEPGAAFSHCRLLSYVAVRMIEQRAGVTLLEYLRTRLFEPIGIGNPDWLACPQGHTMGFSGLYLTVEEMCLLGQFYLDRGSSGYRRLLPEAWFDEACRPHAAVAENLDYGYHVWLPGPGDIVLLKGLYGQGIVVSRAKGAVLAFQSLEGYRYEELIAKAVETVQLLP